DMAMVGGTDAKTLRDTMDKLKDKLKTAAIVLAAVDGDKVQIAAGVTADSIGKDKAGELVNFVAQQVGGKGGGKPDMAMVGGTDAKTLRETMDKLKDKLKTAAIVLAAVDGGKVQLAAGVTADSMGKVKAGELVNFVAQQVGGKGGGKPDMAMAGGTDASGLPQALASVQGWVAERV
ncbi:MAG: DHHA1 domain-containing protein, partial [Hydrogenophaga sp.]